MHVHQSIQEELLHSVIFEKKILKQVVNAEPNVFLIRRWVSEERQVIRALCVRVLYLLAALLSALECPYKH